jgi:phosphoserine phosphatase
METTAGRYTGRLQGEPVAHTHKAAAVSGWIRAHGLDPGACSAYADSRDDLPMLEAVGHAGVVNPSGKLAHVARKRGWEICHWSRS